MGKQNNAYRNRIMRYSEEPPDQLLANPRNWRTHPGSQAEALRGVLADVGYVQAVIVNERTGHLVDGHLRVQEALKAGQATIPVVWVDLSEADEAEVLATLDPLAAMAGTDSAKLDDLLRDVSTDSAAVQAMLDTLATDAGVVDAAPPEAAGVDIIPEQWMVLITCTGETEQAQLLERLSGEGFQCRALTS